MKNIKSRRDLWLFVLFPVVGFSLGILATYIHWAISLLVFPWAILVQYRTSRMCCPHCSQPVGKREVRMFGTQITWWSPLTPRKCVHCGNQLASGKADHGMPCDVPPSQLLH